MSAPLVIYHANEEQAPLSPLDCAYLAGLIDGEGYVGVSGSRNSKPSKQCKRGVALRVMVQVRMTDRRPLDWAAATTGFGVVHASRKQREHYKTPWNWTIWSRQAVDVLKQILTFMKVKAEQSELCIEYQSRMRQPGRLGLSDAEWDFRIRCWNRSKELNRGIK